MRTLLGFLTCALSHFPYAQYKNIRLFGYRALFVATSWLLTCMHSAKLQVNGFISSVWSARGHRKCRVVTAEDPSAVPACVVYLCATRPLWNSWLSHCCLLKSVLRMRFKRSGEAAKGRVRQKKVGWGSETCQCELYCVPGGNWGLQLVSAHCAVLGQLGFAGMEDRQSKVTQTHTHSHCETRNEFTYRIIHIKNI